jgi:hypothetical protein
LEVPEEQDKKKWTTNWTLRKVVGREMRKEVDKRIAECTRGAACGKPEYLAAYSSALTEIVDGLSEQKREEFRSLAEEWNSQGPPRAVQIK